MSLNSTVHILGLSLDTRDLKRVGSKGDQIWGLNQGHNHYHPKLTACCTAWFQIHSWPALEVRHTIPFRPSNHLQFLKDARIPVYLECENPDIPCGVRYPYQAVVAELGGEYFACNSFGWMLGLAISLGYKHIHLRGVNFGPGDISDSYARPMIEYLIGLARGRGVDVTVPEDSGLLKADHYTRSLSQYRNALEMCLDVLRAYSNQLPYMEDGLRVRGLMGELEDRYYDLVKDRAK